MKLLMCSPCREIVTATKQATIPTLTVLTSVESQIAVIDAFPEKAFVTEYGDSVTAISHFLSEFV